MRTKAQILLRAAGLLCVVAAIALTCFNLAQSQHAGESSERIRAALVEHIESSRLHPLQEETTDRLTESEPATVTLENVGYMGVLTLPRLGLSLPVAAVWSYDALRDSPCRYSGTPEDDNLVICAHNYSSHFGRIGELSPGDEATFTDLKGRVIRYALTEAETLAPDAVGDMTDSSFALSLFTCNWNGTARVTLRFDRVSSQSGQL